MITLKDVAREAGVSHATVSYILNDKFKEIGITEQLAKKIKGIAVELGYQRNEIARSMVTGRNDVIAFISCDTGAWEYTGKIMSGIVEEATVQKFAVKVYHLAHSTPDNIIKQLIEQRVAGVIFHSAGEADFYSIRNEAGKKRIPCATVNLSSTAAGIGITSNDFQGVKDAVKHLAELGHRRILYISNKSGMEYAVNRERGFLAGMKAHVPADKPLIAYAPGMCYEENQSLIGSILAKHKAERPTAIICYSDNVACNILQAAYETGVKVPEELSIIGFADLDIARLAAVPLTTVAQPFEQMGRETANMLIEAIKNKRTDILNKVENRKLEVTLVVRKSTATPQKKF